MPWNGSQQNSIQKPTVKVAKKTSWIKYLLFAVILSSTIAGFYFWLCDEPPIQDTQEIVKKKKMVPKKAFKPTTVRKPAEPKKTVQKWPEKSPHPDGEWRHGEGPRSIAVTNGCVVSYPHCPGVQLILPHPKFSAPFKNISDNELARLISIKPGDDFIDAPLPRDFDQRFTESLLSPIQITEDDTPEKAELKRQVIEARKILIDAVKRGESPREIVIEEGKRLRKMMQIKDNYERIIREEIANGATDQDIRDIATAANQLLEKEGIECKVNLPYKVRLRINQQQFQHNNAK